MELAYPVTLADWAYSRNSRRKMFRAWKEQMGTPVQVAEYLTLANVNGKVPVIMRVNSDLELLKYVVPTSVIQETKAALMGWNFIREVAGTVTEFPEKLRAKVEKELSAKYEEEKLELTAEHEARIAQLEQEYLEKIRVQIKSKLMQMAAER